jgi:hypothetical protein
MTEGFHTGGKPEADADAVALALQTHARFPRHGLDLGQDEQPSSRLQVEEHQKSREQEESLNFYPLR